LVKAKTESSVNCGLWEISIERRVGAKHLAARTRNCGVREGSDRNVRDFRELWRGTLSKIDSIGKERVKRGREER